MNLPSQVMFDLLNLSSQHGRLALDLKLANICTGLQPGSAKFPCIYGRYLELSCFLWSLFYQQQKITSSPGGKWKKTNN